MSFELGVWREAAPISREAALAKFRARDFPEDGAAAFWHALRELVDEELLKDSSHAPDHVIVRCPVECMDEISGVVLGLARAHGLVCYDPRRHLVSNLEPLGAFPELRLHTGDGLVLEQPDLGLINDVLTQISAENPFVALVVPNTHFLQTSEEKPGEYTLEFRDVIKSEMIATTIPDRAALQAAFHSYAQADLSFLTHHSWHPIILG